MKKAGIEGTVLFFGSARSRTKEQHKQKFEEMKAAGEDTARLEKTEWMCDLHERLEVLAEKVKPDEGAKARKKAGSKRQQHTVQPKN